MKSSTVKLLWAEELTLEICRLRIAADVCMAAGMSLMLYSVIGQALSA